MFGTYQSSTLRIEVEANADKIAQSLTEPDHLRQWLWPQQVKFSGNGTVDHRSFSSTSAVKLSIGQSFESFLSFPWDLTKISHAVEQLTPTAIRLLLSGSVDGFHEWQWGDGWVQSRLEGVSLLPLIWGRRSVCCA